MARFNGHPRSGDNRRAAGMEENVRAKNPRSGQRPSHLLAMSVEEVYKTGSESPVRGRLALSPRPTQGTWRKDVRSSRPLGRPGWEFSGHGRVGD